MVNSVIWNGVAHNLDKIALMMSGPTVKVTASTANAKHSVPHAGTKRIVVIKHDNQFHALVNGHLLHNNDSEATLITSVALKKARL